MHGGCPLTPAAGVRGRGLTHLSCYSGDDSAPAPSPAGLGQPAAPPGRPRVPRPQTCSQDVLMAGLGGGRSARLIRRQCRRSLWEFAAPSRRSWVAGKGCISVPGMGGLRQGSPLWPRVRGWTEMCRAGSFLQGGGLCGPLMWESLLVLGAGGSGTVPGPGCAIELHRMKPVCVHTHIHTHAHMRTLIHTDTLIHTCTCARTHKYTQYTHACSCTHVHTHSHMCTHTLIHMHTYTRA